MTAATSRGDSKRSGVAESLAAAKPPTTVTRTSMSAQPNDSPSDEPTSGLKSSAPRKAPASTGIQSERTRPSTRPRPRPLVSHTLHASWSEYAKKAENAPSARYARGTTTMVCTLSKQDSFCRRDRVKLTPPVKSVCWCGGERRYLRNYRRRCRRSVRDPRSVCFQVQATLLARITQRTDAARHLFPSFS